MEKIEYFYAMMKKYYDSYFLSIFKILTSCKFCSSMPAFSFADFEINHTTTDVSDHTYARCAVSSLSDHCGGGGIILFKLFKC